MTTPPPESTPPACPSCGSHTRAAVRDGCRGNVDAWHDATPPATVAPVAWAVMPAGVNTISTFTYDEAKTRALAKAWDQPFPHGSSFEESKPYRVVPLYDADVPALMALLKEARGRLAPLPPGVPGTLAHRIDAAIGRGGA